MIKPSKARSIIMLPLLVIAMVILACGSGSPTSLPPTATVSPTETSQPTAVQPPLYLSITMGSVPVKEQGTSPNNTIEADVPTLQGNNDPRVINFNNEMNLLIQQEISKFKDNLREIIPNPNAAGSSFKATYTLLSAPGNILSLKFDIMIYIEGAAHPNTHSRTVTYDLQAGADISLDQLFKPGSDYLQNLSNFCLTQLKPKIPDLFAAGLDPIPSNYLSWNITPAGLLLTFDAYQVAAYALGPQQVTIPYGELKVVIDPHGPLAGMVQ
jgi:hypothetical protein